VAHVQAAYLALSQLLDRRSELVLLLVNTLLVDLKSDNYIVAASALVVVTKLIGPDLINAGAPASRQADRQADRQTGRQADR
jgi:AP-4 complex subunit epsilon-1